MNKKTKFQTPTGMHDIFEDQKYYDKVESVMQKIAKFYNFKKITTPILEDADLFIRGVGDYTDIVEKEMYTFKTKGRDFLALRPEGTASIVRAYIENGMQARPQPVKLWYFGPFFRYEKPQQGRYRQFFQGGFEILGEDSSVFDAQIILLSFVLLKDLGLKDIIVEINSIGCIECRKEYKKILSSFLKKKKDSLCDDCKRRSENNMLRVFDCKKEKCQEVLQDAPQIIDSLCGDCKKHLKQVLEFLDELNIPYKLNPFLVRGLDYYNRTVFEIKSCNDNTLIGGGRYDLLGENLGSSIPIPAVGAAYGVERIVSILKEEKEIITKHSFKIFLIQIGDLAKKQTLRLMEEFRTAKIDISESLAKDSLKLQLTKANKLGIKIVVIIGQKEALENTAILRNMETGTQASVKQENLIKEIKKRIK